MYKRIGILVFGIFCSSCIFAEIAPEMIKPFYVGVSGGFGSTTWRGLVPQDKQNIALMVSTPIEVDEGGFVYGVFTGYELTQYFAVEANYKRYPRATVIFDQFSLFAVDHNDKNSFTSETETVSLMAKVMLTVPKTVVRVYSSFGIAGIHRVDELNKQTHVSPTFGAGFNLNVTPRLMFDIGFNYTAGYGESELNPSNNYMPFLYSGNIGLSYRI